MLGDNIRRLRKEKCISINKLSELTGISLGYLSDIENNKANNPTIDILDKISTALNCSIEDLFINNDNIIVHKDIPSYVDPNGESQRIVIDDLTITKTVIYNLFNEGLINTDNIDTYAENILINALKIDLAILLKSSKNKKSRDFFLYQN